MLVAMLVEIGLFAFLAIIESLDFYFRHPWR